MQNFIKIINVLEPKKKTKVIFLYIAALIFNFLEIFSLSLLPVFFLFITDKDKIINILEVNGLETNFINNYILIDGFEIFLGISVVIIFLIKNILIGLFIIYENKLYQDVHVSISSKLFSNYINLEYKKFISYNHSFIFRNLTTDIVAIKNTLKNYGQLFKDFVLILLILLTLGAIDFIFTFLLISIFGSMYLLYKFFLKKKIINLSLSAQEIRYEFLKIINQSLNIYKILKIYDLLKDYKIKYKNYLNQEEAKLVLLDFFYKIPRLVLEIISVFAIIFSFIYLIYLNEDLNAGIAKTIFFGAALIRILPSANSCASLILQQKALSVSTDLILKEIKKTHNKIKVNNDKKKINSFIDFKKIEIKNLKFSYNKKNTVFNNFSLKIEKGECIGIKGKSGSGKSTLVDILMGIIKVKESSILVDNISINKNLKSWHKKFGYIPQETYIFDANLVENITFNKNNKMLNNKYIKKIILETGLDQVYKNKNNNSLGERGSKLSGGQKQRIGIARALYGKPDILIFDESFSSLDKKSTNNLLNLILKIKNLYTIILISHQDEVFKHCNRVVNIEK
jgi:ATP-binding cassette, subfamily B, bacterial PglK